MRVTALGDLVFLFVKGLLIPEADKTHAPFRLGLRLLKVDKILGLPP